MIGTWVEETNRLILEILDSRSGTEIIFHSWNEDTLYNEEFDPGSG